MSDDLPSWHLSEATHSRTWETRQQGNHDTTRTLHILTDSESTFPAEFDSYQSEWLISGWDKRELSTTEDVWWQGSELRLRVHPAGVLLHDCLKFGSSKLSVQINDRSNGDELHLWMLI